MATLMQTLMLRYDQQFPNATPFSRGAVEHELSKALDAIKEAGYIIVPATNAAMRREGY